MTLVIPWLVIWHLKVHLKSLDFDCDSMTFHPKAQLFSLQITTMFLYSVPTFLGIGVDFNSFVCRFGQKHLPHE